MSVQTKEYASKKNGKINKRYYAVVYDTRTNRTVWSKGFKTEKDAKREEARMLHDLEECTLITEKRNFDEVSVLWLEVAKKEYANSTYKGYEWYYGKYIKPIFGEKDITSILPFHIQKFIDVMSEKYSAETVNKCINILTNIFNYAKDILYAVKANPVNAVKRKKVILKESATWKPEQILAFLKYPKVAQSQYYELIATSFLVGARPSEVCGLKLPDLKPNRTLRFDRGYDRYGAISNMKNHRSHREMMITEFHYSLLINRLKKQNTQALLAKQKDKEYEDNDFLFKQPNGKPINPSVYSKNFRKLLKAYNQEYPGNELPLPEIRLYDARHSFATNLVTEENINTALVASIMGNSERTCNDRYVHPYKDAKESVLTAYQKGVFENKKLSCAN